MVHMRYGHINLAPSHWQRDYIQGQGTVDDPFVSPVLTGQCSSFSSAALDHVGYLDSRFRRYGLEHVEHTFRMIAAGYGGVVTASGEHKHPYLIRSPLTVTELDKGPDTDGVQQNTPIFDALTREPIYRHAWRGDEEMAILRSEMQPFRTPDTAGAIPMAWRMTTFDHQKLTLGTDATMRAGADSGFGNVVVTVEGGLVARLAVQQDQQPLRWLRSAADNRFVPTDDPARATVFDFVSGRGSGFGLRYNSQYLCCDFNHGSTVRLDRTEMHDWETFRYDGYLLAR